jgi:uncharacterized protein YndB with AHSA1/START domain
MQTRDSDQTITSSRIFKHPIEKVFRAWAEPEHLKNWWGPKGFTNTFHEFDFRVGGRWKFTMHGPDKGNYENEAIFKLIDNPNRVVWDRLSKPIFQIDASFEAVSGNQTKLVFKMIFDNSREFDTIKKFAPEKNEENFDRMEVELENMS